MRRRCRAEAVGRGRLIRYRHPTSTMKLEKVRAEAMIVRASASMSER